MLLRDSERFQVRLGLRMVGPRLFCAPWALKRTQGEGAMDEVGLRAEPGPWPLSCWALGSALMRLHTRQNCQTGRQLQRKVRGPCDRSRRWPGVACRPYAPPPPVTFVSPGHGSVAARAAEGQAGVQAPARAGSQNPPPSCGLQIFGVHVAGWLPSTPKMSVTAGITWASRGGAREPAGLTRSQVKWSSLLTVARVDPRAPQERLGRRKASPAPGRTGD